MVIDGYTQPGAVPNTNGPEIGLNTVLQVELDGSLAESWAYGLQISAGNSTVRGLSINRFGAGGVALYDNGDNLIAGNFIGTDVTGTSALGNGMYGVHVYGGSQSNVIGTNGDGTDDAAERNLISGNGWFGVSFSDADTDFSSVAGNLIGTDGDGIADAAERNLISGNAEAGVAIWDAGSDFNSVAGNFIGGNFIGTDVSGTKALGNDGAGVFVYWDAQSNRIGTDGNDLADASERNIISGNVGNGVHIVGDGSAHNVVAGNFIGTDASGIAALSNGRWGGLVDDAFSNCIGFCTSASTTEILPTLNYNASLDDDGDANWQDTVGTIDNNTTAGGTFGDPGSDEDFHLTLDAGVTRVATESSLPGISAAYHFDGTGGAGESSLQHITGNPTDDAATWEIWFKPNDDGDVDLLFESGGTGEGMSIRYDGLYNEVLFTVDSDSVQRTVRGGAISINKDEFNQLVAVYDKDVDVSGNDVLRLYVNGQLVDDSTDDPTSELHDWAGTAQTGVARIGAGVAETGSGTAYEGDLAIIRFYESALSAGDVHANFTHVGGVPDEPNTIAFNTWDGVAVINDDATGNAIRGNQIYQNGGLGINLVGPYGVTPNDSGDVDTGPNNLQNFPLIRLAETLKM